MLDYKEMAALEDRIIRDVDRETIEHLATDITHLIAHSAVNAIKESVNFVDKETKEPINFEQTAQLERTVIQSVDQDTLKCLTSDLLKLIAHSVATGIYQSEKLEENE